MAFPAGKPVIHNGITYPLYGVSLITSPAFGASQVGARIVLNLEPYRINEQGEVERPMMTVETEDGPVQVIDRSTCISIGFPDAYAMAAGDPALAAALGAIAPAIVGFYMAKGY